MHVYKPHRTEEKNYEGTAQQMIDEMVSTVGKRHGRYAAA